MTSSVDPLDADCLAELKKIRSDFDRVRAEVSRWELPDLPVGGLRIRARVEKIWRADDPLLLDRGWFR